MPSLSSGLAAVKPFASVGTRNAVMPLCLFARSVIAKTRHHVRLRAVGDPVLGAVEDVAVAVAHGDGALLGRVGAGLGLGEREAARASRRGRAARASSCFCASVPNLRIGSHTSELLTLMMTPVDGAARARSPPSRARRRRCPCPAPPHSGGTATPRRPSSAMLLHQRRGGTGARSIPRAPWAAARSSANSRAVSWTWRCSSVSSKSMVAPAAPPWPVHLRRPLLEEGPHALLLIGGREQAAKAWRSSVRGVERDRLRPRGSRACLATASGPLARSCGLLAARGRGARPRERPSRTRPMQRFAGAASIVSPVRMSSSARMTPTRRASRWVPPKPGMTPSFTSGWPNFAVARVDEVAGERQLAAAAEREAVHRRDPGTCAESRSSTRVRRARRRRAPPGPCPHRGDVGAGDERLVARAGEDDDAARARSRRRAATARRAPRRSARSARSSAFGRLIVTIDAVLDRTEQVLVGHRSLRHRDLLRRRRRSRAPSCGRASPPRRTGAGAGTAGTCRRRARGAAPRRCEAGVEADEVGERERAHRVVQAELHAGVDVLRRCRAPPAARSRPR